MAGDRTGARRRGRERGERVVGWEMEEERRREREIDPPPFLATLFLTTSDV